MRYQTAFLSGNLAFLIHADKFSNYALLMTSHGFPTVPHNLIKFASAMRLTVKPLSDNKTTGMSATRNT